jgi:hypothetical protein
MTASRPDIEWIVAEVVRRLSRLADGPAKQKPLPTEPLPTATLPTETLPTETELKEAESAPGPAQKTGDLVFESTLLTLASLEGKLHGVRRLLVPTKTVVTPAVRDELRKRKIRLEKGAVATACRTSAAPLWIGQSTQSPEATRRAEALVEAQDHATCSASDLRLVIRQLVDAMDREPELTAILLTDQPLLAACLANRHAALRAVVGNSLDAARTAVRKIAANVLVVEPTCVTPFVWKQLIQSFAPSVPRDVPVELSCDGENL